MPRASSLKMGANHSSELEDTGRAPDPGPQQAPLLPSLRISTTSFVTWLDGRRNNTGVSDAPGSHETPTAKAHWNPREDEGQKEKRQRSEKPVLPVSSKALAAAEQTAGKGLRTGQHPPLQELRSERGLQPLQVAQALGGPHEAGPAAASLPNTRQVLCTGPRTTFHLRAGTKRSPQASGGVGSDYTKSHHTGRPQAPGKMSESCRLGDRLIPGGALAAHCFLRQLSQLRG